MTRVFLDMYLAHNLGDDLFLHIIANRYPNCKFTVNYYKNDYNNFFSSYNNIETRVTLKNRILRKLKIKDYINNIEDIVIRDDMLILLGGSYFMEPVHGDYENDSRNKIIDIFKDRGKNVLILGSNFGPYTSSEFYNHWKNVFKRCDDVCFREKYSYDLFKDIDSVRMSSDVVLGLDVTKYENKKKTNLVGFSIIDVRKKVGLEEYHDKYIQSTIKSIKILIEKGYRCVLMSFCEIEGDLDIINIVFNSLSEEYKKQVSIYEYYDNLEEAINLISSFELFVAARFHANILGLLLNVPIMPIIYSDKTLNVLNDLNLKSIAIKMDDLECIYEEEYIHTRLKEGNAFNHDICRDNSQFEKLDQLLKK